jgi:hypothetical protein
MASRMTCLPRRIIEFDLRGAIVGVALRGHPCDEFNEMGGHGGPPLQVLPRIKFTMRGATPSSESGEGDGDVVEAARGKR